MPIKEYSHTLIDDIINLLIEYSQGKFDKRLVITESDDLFNTVASGLNMLGEELAHNEKQLLDSKSFLQDILSSIDEVIYARKVVDGSLLSGEYTFISDRTDEILGMSVAELMSNAVLWTSVIHPEDALNISGKVNEILKGKEVAFTYRLFHKKKKEYIWLEERLVPQKSNDGTVTTFFGSARDITELKKKNIEIEEKNEFVSRLVATSDQFFYIAAIDKDDSFRSNFTYCSWQIEEIYGATPDELMNGSDQWVDAVHPDDLPNVKRDNQIMFSEKKSVMRTYRVQHKNTGEYIWLEDYVVPVVDDNGDVRELYGSVRDISIRKQDELEKETLIKELSHKVNEVMQFNYIVSHNLRAPVAHIIGLAKLLDTDMPKEDLQATISYISEAAHSMDELINDLNTILSARSDINEKTELVNINDVLRSVCNNLRKEIEVSKVEIEKDIVAEAETLDTIKSYLQSILFNLISNAIKYRSPDRLAHIKVSAEKQGDRTVIRVADNGMGMDMEKYGEKIFGIYNRFHLNLEGKGLGLHMTKTQVESLGGTITVESTPNVGTVFTVTL